MMDSSCGRSRGRLAPPFDTAEACGRLDPKRPQVITLTTRDGTALVLEGATHHLHREALQGFAHDLGALLADDHQPRLAHPRRRERPLHRVRGARPPVGRIQEPGGQGPRRVAPPASPRPFAALARRHALRLEDMGQIAVPRALPPHRHQAQRIWAGSRAVWTHRHAVVARIRAARPHWRPARIGPAGRCLGLPPWTPRGTALAHHGRRQHVAPCGHGVWTNRPRRCPPPACRGSHLLPLGHRRHSAPDQAHHDRAHHRPRPPPRPQANEPLRLAGITPLQLAWGEPGRGQQGCQRLVHRLDRRPGARRAVTKLRRGPALRRLGCPGRASSSAAS